jgi:hypothetical protein
VIGLIRFQAVFFDVKGDQVKSIEPATMSR